MTNTIKRKSLSIIIVFAMIVSMFAGLGITASAYSGGSGTSTDPYQIADAADLQELAADVIGGDSNEGIYFLVTADIDLSGITAWRPIGAARIGQASTYSPQVMGGNGFAGNFNGGGHTISGLTVTASQSGAGLFQYLEPAGTVASLAVTGTVNVSDGIDAVAGVVGYNSGTITNVVSGVAVTANDAYNIGGIAGFNNGYYQYSSAIPAPVGIIANSVNVGAIMGGTKVGGIAGENSGTIVSCYNTGAIGSTIPTGSIGVGGIAGRNGNNNIAVESGFIANCYNAGAIGNGDYTWIGGIAGFNNELSYIYNCYDTGFIYKGYSSYNPIVGHQESVTLVDKCYSLQGLNASSIYDDERGTVMLQADMQATSFGDLLNANANANAPSGIWTQTSGSYPDLARSVLPSAYTVTVTSPPTTLNYTAGDMFDTTGMVLTVTGGGSTFPVSAYSLSDLGPLTASVTSETVYTVAANTVFTGSFDITVAGPANTPITEGGAYRLTNYDDGLLQIQTADPVTLIGQGTSATYYSRNINVQYTVPGGSLTLANVYLSVTTESAIEFVGQGNELTLSTTNIVDTSANNNAAIHVPSDGSLTIGGNGTLYLYKDSLAAGIGGDFEETNGAITVNSGNLFLKGTRSGAVIGTGGNAPAPSGDITFNGGMHNIATVSQGAGIGGGSGSKCGNVRLNAGSLNVVSNYYGSAIGSGDATGLIGTLFMGGALLNAIATPERPTDAPPLITTRTVDASGTNDVYPVPLTVPTAAVTNTFAVQVDSVDGYVGKLNDYNFKDIRPDTYTPENWTVDTTLTDITLYLVGGEDHLVNVGGDFQEATWDSASGGFTLGAAPTITLGNTASSSDYTTWPSALAALGNMGLGVLEVEDSVALAASLPIGFAPKLAVTRASGYNGEIMTIDTGVTVTISAGTFDGGLSPAASGSIIGIEGGTLDFSGGALINNITTGSGSGVTLSSGAFNLAGGAVKANTAAVSGGGVYVTSGAFNPTGGTVSNNTAANGGGVYTETSFAANSGAIANNAATGNGGGVYVSAGTLTLGGANISGNSAASGGGAYVGGGGTLTVNSGSLSSNSAANGGAIYAVGTVSLNGGTLAGNTATTGNGGAVYVGGGATTLDGATVTNNVGPGSGSQGGGFFLNNGAATLTLSSGGVVRNHGNVGGGVYANSGALVIDGASIDHNTAASGGGLAILNGTSIPVVFSDGSISYNTGNTGGGVFINYGILNMSGGTVAGNSSESNGGGVYVFSGTSTRFNMSGGTITENKALGDDGYDGYGGGVEVRAGAATISGTSVITNNTAADYGGGVHISSGVSVTISGATISGNTATRGNGIYVSASNTLTLAPVNESVSFDDTDDIYLPSGVTFAINTALDGGLAEDTIVPLVFANPVAGRLVAVAIDSDVADESYYMLQSGSIAFDVQGANIVIAVARTRVA